MKTYKGVRSAHGCVVTVDGSPLDLRLDLKIDSPGGFEWGYDGTGPRQLALAILAEHFGDGLKALDKYRTFAETVIAAFKGDEWELTGQAIESALDQVVEVPMDLETLLTRIRGHRP